MKKTDNLTIRVEPVLKKNVEGILDDLGMSMAQAINMYFKQIEMTNSIPFNITKCHEIKNEMPVIKMENNTDKKIVNKEIKFNSVEDMWKSLEEDND